ncbi:hypothetical protein KW850_29785 [Bacillus sp. sid0103]|nr:hypothetical protein [Bacillus sp. sid0103]MBV7509368.1 hypothetical protein [Bacillus sp. sid0103]
MEHVCTICGDKKDVINQEQMTVLIICETCLGSDDLDPFLENFLQY